jgi:hypothetical protein
MEQRTVREYLLQKLVFRRRFVLVKFVRLPAKDQDIDRLSMEEISPSLIESNPA